MLVKAELTPPTIERAPGKTCRKGEVFAGTPPVAPRDSELFRGFCAGTALASCDEA
jgi:hypothetical protein